MKLLKRGDPVIFLNFEGRELRGHFLQFGLTSGENANSFSIAIVQAGAKIKMVELHHLKLVEED